MNFSQMSSREKTIVAVLGVVILLALVGIGILVARLITGGEEEAITVIATSTVGEAPATEGGQAATSEPGASEAPADITPVAPPSLEGLEASPAEPVSDQAVVVARQESIGPGLPVIIADHPLHAGRRYRIEITAAGGAKVPIQGSWGQAATSASGQVEAPQVEFFEGVTPFRVEVVAPVPDPVLWSCSVSAGPGELLAQPAILVITIWDVTGVQ